MKIAFISLKIYPCDIGGNEIFNYHLLKELAILNHKIWVITYCDYNWDNKNIQTLRMWRKIPIIHNILGYFSLIINLLKLKNKVDIIHVPYTSNSGVAFPILFVYKLFGIKYIIMIHGGGMYKWKYRFFQKPFFKNARNIIAVSEIIKDNYEKRSGRKIIVIPPLIPFEKSEISKDKMKIKYGFDKKDIILLSIGSIKKIKGSEILLDAFIKLGLDYINKNNLKLLFVGDGVLRKSLEEKTVKMTFNQYIKFLGKIAHEQINEIFCLADIFIIPSFFEGLPISLLEAMFNGMPIIGSDVNGINTLIKHMKNGLLFEKGNIDYLTSYIKQLVEDKNLANSLGNIAKFDFSQRYSYNDMILEHIEIYSKVIKG